MQSKRTVIAACLVMSTTLTFPALGAGAAPDAAALVAGNSAFACDLYQKLRVSEGNLFFSPYSVSAALAMTYAGARGETESQMAKTLRFSMNQDVHPAFAELAASLATLQKAGSVRLVIANSLWPQKSYPFLETYLTLIRKNYGVAITPLDFKADVEGARNTINAWVEKETQKKIKNLVPPGILDPLTRLVLVNAIYFRGKWQHPFTAQATRDAPFRLAKDNDVPVPMMTQQQKFRHADLESLAVLELPYAGNELSMLILLPKEIEGLKQLEAGLSPEKINIWKSRMSVKEVNVFLPRFRMTCAFRLDNALVALGMPDAFSESKADFSGMDGRPNWLYIGVVLHKAFVDVNEEGTEAAAATAVVMKEKMMATPPVMFRADHPFLFLIQEKQTGSILFMGRMADPTQAGE